MRGAREKLRGAPKRRMHAVPGTAGPGFI